MTEWWEFPEEQLVPVKPDLPVVRSRADRIAAIEEEVHSEAATIIRDAMHFANLPEPRKDPETGEALPPEPPAEWIKELGEEGARRRLKTAAMATLPSADAPVGLKLAKDTLVGMSKAKAQRKAPSTTLNMVVLMGGPLPQYPRREILK